MFKRQIWFLKSEHYVDTIGGVSGTNGRDIGLRAFLATALFPVAILGSLLARPNPARAGCAGIPASTQEK